MIVLSWVSNNSLHITSTMQDADDAQAVISLEIGNQISPYRKAAQTTQKLVAPSPGVGMAGQVLELRIDQIDEGVGLGRVVGGDELPDLCQITAGAGGENDRQHKSNARLGIDLRPQALSPRGFNRLRVPGHRIATVQPVLDGATQLLELQIPQLILVLHQP